MTTRKRGSTGAYVHSDYRRNHVIWPGREEALEEFLGQSFGGLRGHKKAPAKSSNSEDALTWSCFDCLRQVEPAHRRGALKELWELAFDGARCPEAVLQGLIQIGKQYPTVGSPQTEVDASVESAGALVFIEAKLYSTMSQANPPRKPFNQIERKLRVGVAEARGRDFYFIVLDVARPEHLLDLNPGASLQQAKSPPPGRFRAKWLTAYWFKRYRGARGGNLTPLRKLLEDIPEAALHRVHLGWLTWADLFKPVLRAVIADGRTRPR